MIVQLNPPIPLKTPKGNALAQALIDYGIEHDLVWVCFQQDTGEVWCWRNPEVRAQTNITMGRKSNNQYSTTIIREWDYNTGKVK